MAKYDEEYDEEFDDDYASFDTSDSDDDATIPCPHCGQSIFEDAIRCPECGAYISEGDRTAVQRAVWVLVGLALCLLIVLFWIVGGL